MNAKSIVEESGLLHSNRIVRYQGRVDDRFGYTHKRDQTWEEMMIGWMGFIWNDSPGKMAVRAN